MSRASERHFESERIRRDIERTRAEMDETIDELEHRLSPRELMDNALSYMRREGRGIGDVVREHPVPLALMGLGVAWLAVEEARDGADRPNGRLRGSEARAEGRVGPYRGDAVTSDEGWPHSTSGGIREKAADVKEKIAGAVDQVRERAGELKDSAAERAHRARTSASEGGERVSDAAHRASDEARYQARKAKQNLLSFIERSPLGAGAIAFGVGLASGLAAPASELENELMGEASDVVKQRAKDASTEAGRVVSEKAQETVDRIEQVEP